MAAFLAEPKVARWLDRYPPDPATAASFDEAKRTWMVHVWSGKAGEIAQGLVDDADGQVTEAWTGPQVAWQMARGRPGAFGGRLLTSWPVWLGLSAAFFLGLVDLRRPLSMRTLDLLALLSFGVSLLFFNRGEVFESAALAVPPLVYLLVRTAWIGFRSGARAGPTQTRWPVWLLAAVTLFLVGFRVGLDVEHPRTVIDVGYAGVIGADRILDGRAPYGAMPVDGGRACAPPRSDGRIRERIQADGRCESTNPRGDTYGPVAYLAYVPAVLAFGWSGLWDDLPAAHAVAIAADLAGAPRPRARRPPARRRAPRRHARLRLGGVPVHDLRPPCQHERRADARVPRVGLLARVVARRPAAPRRRSPAGRSSRRSSIVPLWLTYRSGLRPVSVARFAAAFGATTVLAFSILLLEPSLWSALETFWDRTVGFQLGRDSPFSDLGLGASTTPRGSPTSRHCRPSCRSGRSCSPASSRSSRGDKGPLELAALTAAVLLAVQLSLTHWFYLYLPWVLPFALLALFAPRLRPASHAVGPCGTARPSPQLAAAGVFVAVCRRASPLPGSLLGDAVTDIPLYRTYGERVADGLVPYRDFAFEYPPGALPSLVLPALVTDSLEAYRAVFVAELALVGALAVLAFDWALRGLGRARTRPARRARV